MKKITVFTFILGLLSFQLSAQFDASALAEIQDKMAIKQVVDTFSILADTKEIDKQVLLFTENAIVESKVNGQLTKLQGRPALFQAFSGFLSAFRMVYHQNGQQTITLKGDEADAISYCRVLLIGNLNGKESKTTFYIIYHDKFVKQAGKWLIAHRLSDFVHTENEVR